MASSDGDASGKSGIGVAQATIGAAVFTLIGATVGGVIQGLNAYGVEKHRGSVEINIENARLVIERQKLLTPGFIAQTERNKLEAELIFQATQVEKREDQVKI